MRTIVHGAAAAVKLDRRQPTTPTIYTICRP